MQVVLPSGPVHIVSPGGHMLSQTPLRHWCPGSQRFPHEPQLRGSIRRSAHRAPHCEKPGSHEQTLAEQFAPGPHCWPHAPQLNAFDVKSTQAPLQSVNPLSHFSAHADREQTWPLMHTLVQEPQCAGSLVVSVHTPSQRIWPFGQAQLPLTHEVPPLQRTPHAPQLARSVFVSTHASPHCVRLDGHSA